MILLDENTLRSQLEFLEARRLPVRKVGWNWGRDSMSDDEILAKLKGTRQVTFFTRDAGFYRRVHCHSRYCLVLVSAPPKQLAAYAIRFLRHPAFRTHTMRMGKVIRVQFTGIVYWERNTAHEIEVAWS